jgi:carboxymethylenebutenolidase
VILQEDPHVDLETPTGPMRTYVYRPTAPGRYPGLVFFSEIFQRTGPIKRTAALFAGHGFVVAVPEIFHDLEAPGCEIAYDAAGADRGNADKIAKAVSAYDDDARAVIRFLRAHPSCDGKIGSIGICIGGHLSFRCSMNSEVLAGVCFYATDIHKGSLGKGGDDTLARMRDVNAEMLMIWGRQDPHVPYEGRLKILNAMHEANLTFTWHEFNGQHAFMRDEGPRYDPALALACYRLAIDLFKRKLGEGDRPAAAAGGGESRH